MVDVWEKLGDCFGGTFENGFGNADGNPIKTWTAGLAIYSETSIRAALDLMRAWEKPWPPSLGEFAALCRQHRPAISPNRQITHVQRAPRDVGDKYLKLMRRIQRGDYPSEDEIRNAGSKP